MDVEEVVEDRKVEEVKEVEECESADLVELVVVVVVTLFQEAANVSRINTYDKRMLVSMKKKVMKKG